MVSLKSYCRWKGRCDKLEIISLKMDKGFHPYLRLFETELLLLHEGSEKRENIQGTLNRPPKILAVFQLAKWVDTGRGRQSSRSTRRIANKLQSQAVARLLIDL